MEDSQDVSPTETEKLEEEESHNTEDSNISSGQKSHENKRDPEFLSEMNQLSEALKETLRNEADNTSDNENDDNSSDEFVEAKNAIDDDVEFDDEYLKELYKDLSELKLKELKQEVNTLKGNGNEKYKNGNFSEAMTLYTEALNNCPLECTTERSILYANRAAAKISLEKKEEAVLDCNKALELNPTYVKALSRRAQLHRKMENLEQSLEDYKKVLEYDRTNKDAIEACMVLPQEINEKNERLKAEMLGKLKDLGNMVLRPFGLSTDNFNMVQDPNSGGYSINFQNNPSNNK